MRQSRMCLISRYSDRLSFGVCAVCDYQRVVASDEVD